MAALRGFQRMLEDREEVMALVWSRLAGLHEVLGSAGRVHLVEPYP